MNGYRTEPLSTHASPHYLVLSKKEKYCNVENYAKAEKLGVKYGELSEQAKQIKRTAPNQEDQLQRLRDSFDRYKEFRIKVLKEIIQHSQNSPDPFSRLYRLKDRGLDILVLWPEIELAFEDLMAETGDELRLTDAEKQAELDQIEQEKAEIKAQMDELLLPGYFLTRHGEIQSNAYQEHVAAWRSLQQFVVEPCSALGVDLDHCPDYEREAHRILNIGAIKRSDSARHAFIPE
jgi:hypothetical protein